MMCSGGCRFASMSCRLTTARNPVAAHWHLENLDIRHVYIRPRTPHLNGKVERSHRVDDQEFYQLLDQAASATTFTSSTTSCWSGKTITITTGRTELSAVRPHTNGYSPK